MPKSERATKRVELHSHSTASDGAYGPHELARKCAEHDVELWSLTDHDNCEACGAAREASSEFGIDFLPGIEISAYVDDRSVHVLGYGVEPESEPIGELARLASRARRDRMREMVHALSRLGVGVDFETVDEIADGAPLSRAHLAEAMLEGGAVDSIDDAFDRFIGVEGPAYVPVGWPTVPEAIQRIHRAGGASVLAHPARHGIDDRIAGWARAGLDGLEVGHPTHGAHDEERYEQIAGELGLVTTRSSDFHGGGHAGSGDLGETLMPEEELDALFTAIEQHR